MKKYLIALIVLLASVAVAVALYQSSPKTKKTVPKRPVPFVETAELTAARHEIFIEAFGTVVPAQRITLQSEVEGRITDQHPELVPGGLITQGDVVIQVDPANYRLSVNEYRAELQEVLFELELEEGRQIIARREWSLLEEEISTSPEGKSLALREPHLRLVRAKVDKAKSRLAAAELALERTTTRSPFNAVVLEEFIDRGQMVSRQAPLATLAGTDQFWVQVSVPVSLLQKIRFSRGPDQKGADVQVIFEAAGSTSLVRTGQVLRLMGDLDPEGRMARILIVVSDPLTLDAPVQTRSREALLLGSYVKVVIDAGALDNVYSIPRQALREGEVIWVQDSEEKLQIRNLDIVWRRNDDVLARAELSSGDRLILSRLTAPLPGITVKAIEKGDRQ